MDDHLDYLVAQLINVFHLTPQEIGNLTRVQIQKLYCYPRDRDGVLISPSPEVKPIPKPIDKLDLLKLLKSNLNLPGIDDAIQKETTK